MDNDLTPRQRAAFLGVCVLYTAVVIPIGVHRGGDLVNELVQTERLLTGEPLYLSNPTKGIYWPPFALFALTPFALLARLSLPLAKALFAAGNVGCLAWCVARLGRERSWRAALIAVFAVGKPLQANFENLNINIVLMTLVVAATLDLQQRRERRAGWWIGLGTALKAFPGLILLYFARHRRWRGLAVGVAAAVGLTYAAMLPYGPVGALETVQRWLALNREAQMVQGFGGQPLGGLVLGLGGSSLGALIASAACLVLVLGTFARRPPGTDPLYEVGVLALVAVLLSPIAHFHYWVLAIPAWVVALTLPPPTRIAWARVWTAVLVVAGVLLSGILTSGLYPAIPFVTMYVRHYNYVWGSLLLFGALLARSGTEPRPADRIPSVP